MINILFIGDIIGASGLSITLEILPKIQQDYDIDFTIANGENIKQGKGLKSILLVDLKASEIGFFDEIGSIYTNQILQVRE